MSAVLAWIFTNPTLLAILAGIIGAFGFGMQQRVAGARREREKRAAEELQARDIADQVDNDIGALPGNKAREELKKWSRG